MSLAVAIFERVFREFGLPEALRTDNGLPFASAHVLYGLSTLSVWWLRLGIRLERITPGHREQNGRHERLHLTLKTEATRPAAANVLQQQARFDDFLEYPLDDFAITVTPCGRICLKTRKINLSHVFAGQRVYDLGYFDDEMSRLEPIDNPFGATVLPMRPA